MVHTAGRNFAVLGSGRQGTAAAYDLAKFGNVDSIIIGDIDEKLAQQAATRVNELLNIDLVRANRVDVTNEGQLTAFLKEIGTVISAVPYYYNLQITKVAIASKTNMCDLGGNTELVLKQMELNALAEEADISIIPDCGQVPGMGTTLCVYAMSLLDKPEEVYMWDGGLPQVPRPPFNYLLTFNIEGLINEYYGKTEFLREGEIVEIPCFIECEDIEFPLPVGKLEAFTTAGGTSTAPRTFQGQLKTYQNKTVRHPGHYVDISNTQIAPRTMLAKLLEPKITFPDDKDVVVIRVKCQGEKDGKPAQAQVDLMDFYDETTGFTAMERTTGWDISIVAIMMADGQAKKGVAPLELAISSQEFVQKLAQRGISVSKQVTFLS
ncbi:MAG: saccharopine dehydrogenase family protein [Candidatus Hodarchaeales archaeon]|jgi:lysine 6-dehydrogenase